jgi:Uma2 family endonuclease
MSATFVNPPVLEPSRKKRFTRQEVERLLDTGIFDGQRWELIDGELFDKMGQNPPHSSTVRRVLRWLTTIFGGHLVQGQLPIETKGEDRDWSVPEPDAAVFFEDKPEYDTRHPRGDEIRLAVEVADSSVSIDLNRKADLYANAGVAEYWVLDLNRRMMVTHRQPVDGHYRQIRKFGEEDRVSPEGREESILVKELLPARA